MKSGPTQQGTHFEDISEIYRPWTKVTFSIVYAHEILVSRDLMPGGYNFLACWSTNSGPWVGGWMHLVSTTSFDTGWFSLLFLLALLSIHFKSSKESCSSPHDQARCGESCLLGRTRHGESPHALYSFHLLAVSKIFKTMTTPDLLQLSEIYNKFTSFPLWHSTDSLLRYAKYTGQLFQKVKRFKKNHKRSLK